MWGHRIENEVDIYATNLTSKTKCMNINAKKWKKMGFCKVLVLIVQVDTNIKLTLHKALIRSI
jgi:hypothetical protein